MFLEQKDTALLERMVEAIRFDVDYHLLSGTRTQTPIQGTISKDLYRRIEMARDKGKPVYHPDIRRRVFSALGVKGTVEHQLLFTEAQCEFKRRLKRVGDQIAATKQNNHYNNVFGNMPGALAWS